MATKISAGERKVRKAAERLGLDVSIHRTSFYYFCFYHKGEELGLAIKTVPAALKWLNGYGIGFRHGVEAYARGVDAGLKANGMKGGVI